MEGNQGTSWGPQHAGDYFPPTTTPIEARLIRIESQLDILLDLLEKLGPWVDRLTGKGGAFLGKAMDRRTKAEGAGRGPRITTRSGPFPH